VKKPGRDLRDKVEMLLAWKRVEREMMEGTLGADFDKADRADVRSKVADANEAVKDEIWGGYRYIIIADSKEKNGLKVIDLGAGHSSGSESLSGRIITALKSQGLLSESVGAGYIDRNWPPALKESGAWPLSGLRQNFLNGALTRLMDTDTTLKEKIVEFVSKGEFGLTSGYKSDGTYDRVWYQESISRDEVVFESGVFLLKKEKAKALAEGTPQPPIIRTGRDKPPVIEPAGKPETEERPIEPESPATKTIRLSGNIPPEVWNRLGTKILPKLRSGTDLKICIDFFVTVSSEQFRSLETDLYQILSDLGLSEKINIE
jgi:hypothetical protein